MITNTYGIPTYGEVNPAVFTVVTFPFLFAIMFGDYGHGSIILFLGAVLCLFNERLKKTSLKFLGPFRYMLFLIGLFSCFVGLIYNEWFAIPYDWFGTCYDVNVTAGELGFN